MPQQHNGKDGGLFTIGYAGCILKEMKDSLSTKEKNRETQDNLSTFIERAARHTTSESMSELRNQFSVKEHRIKPLLFAINS